VVVTPPKPRLAAPTTTSGVSDGETTAERNWRINQENINDRHAAELAFEGSKLRHNDGSIEPLYTLAETLAQFEEIAAVLNTRFRARLAGGLVGAAQAAGATLTSVRSAWCRREHSLRGGGTSPRLDSNDRGLAEALFALSDVLGAMLDRKPQPQPNTPRPATAKPTTQRQDRRRGGIPQ
jgi:hypothetical protein